MKPDTYAILFAAIPAIPSRHEYESGHGGHVEFCASCGALQAAHFWRLDDALRKCGCGCMTFLEAVMRDDMADQLRAIFESDEHEPAQIVTVEKWRKG